MHPARLHALNPLPAPAEPGGEFVLLWVQAAVRVAENPALEHAAALANRLDLPLVAVFGLTPGYPEANARHYRFLLEGLRDLRAGLRERGVPLHLGLGEPTAVVLGRSRGAVAVVTDIGYTRVQRQWRAALGRELAARGLSLLAVETEAVVPVGVVSARQEYAARTIRPKLGRHLADFLHPVVCEELRRRGHPWDEGEDLGNVEALLARLPVDHGVLPGAEEGGERAAQARLASFVAGGPHHGGGGLHRGGLHRYALERGDPNADVSSRLSAHLHYGQLSPVTVARAVQAAGAEQENTAAFLEELIVRRELSFNYVWYCADYDAYAGVPEWARRTLEAHASDPREHLYSDEQFEQAQTHDPYWNAAQREMVRTGRMHNSLRMYWGKKILEWTPSPQEAHRVTLWLNNKHEQDGRDPNSYASVNWVLGLHDRPWARRPIFGTVRYMAASGLRRKFDIEAYARRWNGQAG